MELKIDNIIRRQGYWLMETWKSFVLTIILFHLECNRVLSNNGELYLKIDVRMIKVGLGKFPRKQRNFYHV